MPRLDFGRERWIERYVLAKLTHGRRERLIGIHGGDALIGGEVERGEAVICSHIQNDAIVRQGDPVSFIEEDFAECGERIDAVNFDDELAGPRKEVAVFIVGENDACTYDPLAMTSVFCPGFKSFTLDFEIEALS